VSIHVECIHFISNRAVVEEENARIRTAAQKKVEKLIQIRDYRKHLRYLEWERRYTEGVACDAEDRFSDMQLLRVTKELRKFLDGGDVVAQQQQEIVRVEQRGAFLRNAHRRKLAKLDKALARLRTQAVERERENKDLEQQLLEVADVVKVRRGIRDARVRGAAGGLEPAVRAGMKMERMVRRSRLLEQAKSQARDIEFLRSELNRLRRKNFPSFEHMHGVGIGK